MRNPITKWQAFAPVAADFSEVERLRTEWELAKPRVSDEDLADFAARTLRRQSIETGVIEGTYTLTPSASAALEAFGFKSEFAHPASSDMEPETQPAVPRDQMEGVKSAESLLSAGYPMSAWAIKGLHQEILAHQPTAEAATVIDGRLLKFDATLTSGLAQQF